jgi:hypothetical protein
VERNIINDKLAINRNVTDKYKETFDGANGKRLLPPFSDKILECTDSMILTSLISLNLSKATSWDFTPGKSYDIFLKNTSLISCLTRFLNILLATKRISDEIVLARLFCHNINANQPGTEDSIRPVVITRTVTKLIEFPLNMELKQIPLNKAQFGFREKLSTELNILRLRAHKALYHNCERKKNRKSTSSI